LCNNHRSSWSTTKMKLCLILAFSCIANGLQHDLLSTEDTILPAHDKCKQITEPLCIDIPYNKTIMPNKLGHSTQEEAGLEVQQYFPLINIECSPDLQLFLCSVYFPVCTILENPLPPCRSLCLSAKRGCEGVMLKFGFKWPDNLNCEQYPENSDLCIQNRNIKTPSPTEPPSTTEPPDFSEPWRLALGEGGSKRDDSKYSIRRNFKFSQVFLRLLSSKEILRCSHEKSFSFFFN
jgi:frizzled protein 1/7